MATKTFSTKQKSWTTPRQKSGCTKMLPQLFWNWNCKTGNVARENGGMQNVPEQNAGGDKKWQKCKNGKNGKTGSGGEGSRYLIKGWLTAKTVIFGILVIFREPEFLGGRLRNYISRLKYTEIARSALGPLSTKKVTTSEIVFFAFFFKILHFLSFSFCRFFDQNLKLESEMDVNCKKSQPIHFLQAIKVVAWT